MDSAKYVTQHKSIYIYIYIYRLKHLNKKKLRVKCAMK